MPSTTIIDIIEKHPGEFLNALKTCAYNFNLDNDNAYQFRTKKITPLTEEEKQKNAKYKAEDLKLAKRGRARKIKSTHLKNTIKVSLNNNERLNTPLENKADDPSLYSNINDADTFANAARAIYLIGTKNGAHKGSRITLVTDQEDEDFDSHDYLMFAHDQSLFRIRIGESQTQANPESGQYNINRILRKYLKKLSQAHLITDNEKSALLKKINKDELSPEEVIGFKKLLNHFLTRQDISFGWANRQKIMQMYPHKYARYALLAKKARNADSKVLMVLGMAMLFAPFASTLLSLYVTQRSARYVFVEAANAKYRVSHYGYNPEGEQMLALQRESLKFSLATMPCSALSFFFIAKDMSILQVSALGHKSPNFNLGDYLFSPLENFISACTAPFISGLGSQEARVVLALLSGLTMACLVTAASCMIRLNDKVRGTENLYHVRKPIWEEFAYGFIAGLLCYSGSLVGRSEKFSWARVIEELVYATTTLGLAFKLYQSKPQDTKNLSATQKPLRHSTFTQTTFFDNTNTLSADTRSNLLASQ